MKTITSREINDLYKKVGVNPKQEYGINTTVNKGTLSNKLVGMNNLNKFSKINNSSMNK